jgi:hypothetical protein
MTRKRKIHEDTDLTDLMNTGDLVDIWIEPLTAESLGKADPEDMDDDFPYATSEIRARLAGRFRGVVTEVRPWYVTMEADGDDHYENGCELTWGREELTHVQVVGRGDSTQGRFGNLRLSFRSGRIYAGPLSYREVTSAEVSAIAHVRGWVYPCDPHDNEDREEAWDFDTRIAPCGFSNGCQDCTLDELDEALDWCAARLWGYEP